MTRAIEEVIEHINKRIELLENELKRLDEVRQGITDGRGPVGVPRTLHTLDRKVA